MSGLPRVLPWIDWDEWLTVKNCICSTDSADIILALEIVSNWRVRGKIPHSVESTAQLLEIGLNDVPGPKYVYASPTFRTESELRLQYATSIVRAVNGLVDSNQQGYFADSVYSLALAMGLPGWFVELRHDSTHNQLPSLNVLRAASRRLIVWYIDNYWHPQAALLQRLSSNCLPGSATGGAKTASSSSSSGKEGTSSMNTSPEFSPTLLSEIFIPIFLDFICADVIASGLAPRSGSSVAGSGVIGVSGSGSGGSVSGSTYEKRQKPVQRAKRLAQQEQFWWPHLCKVSSASSSSNNNGSPFFNTLVSRISMHVMDAADKWTHGTITSMQLSWRIESCTFWLEKLLQEAQNKQQSAAANNSMASSVGGTSSSSSLAPKSGNGTGTSSNVSNAAIVATTGTVAASVSLVASLSGVDLMAAVRYRRSSLNLENSGIYQSKVDHVLEIADRFFIAATAGAAATGAAADRLVEEAAVAVDSTSSSTGLTSPRPASSSSSSSSKGDVEAANKLKRRAANEASSYNNKNGPATVPPSSSASERSLSSSPSPSMVKRVKSSNQLLSTSSSSSSSSSSCKLPSPVVVATSASVSPTVTAPVSTTSVSSNNNNSSMSSSSCWVQCTDFPAWPVGLMPGTLSSSYPLYLLEEV